VNRDNLLAAETPQAFSVELYERAITFSGDSITDDNMLFERAGKPVSFVLLNHPNIKITTQSDLEYAEFLINKSKPTSDYRVGQGYDVHRLVQGRDLILGGVNIPFEKGLLGHSDADVLVHAIMDSLLGSVGLGDIGRHFPDSDEKYRGISSIELLKEVRSMVYEAGFEIINIDATVIIQSPKIAPYIENMKTNVSTALDISADRINIKATTEERLGFTGRGEGAKAEAIALVRKK
jgi:2-C-methyl-D-erythritol 4-phosphate cytidylyltransferase/2-C-methyl-D-erythritol 2,4-cyclodiphosphate synthase